MKYALMFYPGSKKKWIYSLKHAEDDVVQMYINDGDRYLTPAETAAYLLGAPASSFPVEAPKDEEGAS